MLFWYYLFSLGYEKYDYYTRHGYYDRHAGYYDKYYKYDQRYYDDYYGRGNYDDRYEMAKI